MSHPNDPAGQSGQRREEIAANLRAVRRRLDAACSAAGRAPDEVELLAVTKTFPAADVALLADLGVLTFAENREQEARDKVREFAELRPSVRPRWHMVGQLQRNKARAVVRWADIVESVDTRRLAESLRRAVASAWESGERSDPLDVLVQVGLDTSGGRGGCPPDQVLDLARWIDATDELNLRGVMAIAPVASDANESFLTLSRISSRVRDCVPDAVDVSAGMSEDLETAVAHGSTRVRVGTALLGGRELTSL